MSQPTMLDVMLLALDETNGQRATNADLRTLLFMCINRIGVYSDTLTEWETIRAALSKCLLEAHFRVRGMQ